MVVGVASRDSSRELSACDVTLLGEGGEGEEDEDFGVEQA